VTGDRIVSHGPGGDLWGDAQVIESDPPRRLVHGWQSLYDPELANEEPSRVTWEIEPAQSVSGIGWMFVVSGLKTLLETGQPLV
jgi:hypothetical protein